MQRQFVDLNQGELQILEFTNVQGQWDHQDWSKSVNIYIHVEQLHEEDSAREGCGVSFWIDFY